MTSKNDRTLLLYYVKLCASFQIHRCIITGSQSGNAQFESKLAIFCLVWPWNSMDDLRKQQGNSSQQHRALCIFSSSYMNQTGVMVRKRLIWVWPLWPWHLTFCMDLILVFGINSLKFHDDDITIGNSKKVWDRRTDGRTDRQKIPFTELLGRAKNNSAPLLCYFKHCASFRSHW